MQPLPPRNQSLSLFNELKRRNVLRVGAAYVVVAWLIIQVAETLFPLFGFDETPARMVVIVLAIGFFPVLVFSWVFELTPEGLKKEKDIDRIQAIGLRTGKKLDQIIIILLALALGYFAVDKFLLDPVRDQEQTELASQAAVEQALTELESRAPLEKSIVVLPFVDLSADQDQEYFSDGLAEEMLNLLANLPDLLVISRTSAFSFKGKNSSIAEIASDLNVTHVLEGSVRAFRDRIRITAQLIDTRTDTHLWSEKFDRTRGDIFAIQEDIATAIVEALKVKLLDGPLLLQRTDPEAYRLYTRAKQVHETSLDPEQQRGAQNLLRKALDIDPTYAPAWSLLSRIALKFDFQSAREAAQKALELDPRDGVAWATLGILARREDGDIKSAASYIQKAAALNPADLMTLNMVGFTGMLLGRLDEATKLMEYAVARDPLMPRLHENLMRLYCFAADYERCSASARRALALNDKAPQARCFIAFQRAFFDGDGAAALNLVEKEPSEPCRLATVTVAHHALGDAAASDSAMAELLEKYPYESSNVYAFVGRGKVGEAMIWVNQNAETLGAAGLAFLNLEPIFSDLRALPEFQQLLKEYGVSTEQLAEIEFNIERFE